jgi:uncharacterized protein (TIGR03437 family)
MPFRPTLLFSFAFLSISVAAGADCSRTSVGLKPLNEPFFGEYNGNAGGLYPGGANHRPAAHETTGLAQAAQVLPRNAAGDPDPQNGKIALLSIGIVNASQEFSAFINVANNDSDKNPKLVFVDGAQNGWSAERIVADPETYWTVVDQRLKQAGVTGAQVQAAWVKLDDPSVTIAFPVSAKKLQSETETILQLLRARYSNTRLAYLSSRIYAGYNTTNVSTEPSAYQGGLAMRWVIEDQINAASGMSAVSGKVPWVAWGPYLWADGLNRRFDGLTWACDDFQQDGTLPSPSGVRKVAQMLLDFFKSDTTSRPWFVIPTDAAPPSITSIVNAAGYFPQISTGSIATILGTNLAPRSEGPAQLPLPVGLAGTSVFVGDEPALLYFVSPKQINFLAPANASGTVRVVREGKQTASADGPFAFYLEGLFSLNGSGTGSAAARHAGGALITPDNPAKIGETIELYGTGQGIRNPAILIPTALPVVRVGGVFAVVSYYGPSGGFPGLDQLNIMIPAASPGGDAVPVNVQLLTFTSNTVTLSIR